MVGKNVYPYLLALTMFVLGCDTDIARQPNEVVQNSDVVSQESEIDRVSDVRIRIANRGSVELDNVIVRFPSQTEDYGSIPPGGMTEYIQVREAYSYAPIQVSINGELKKLIPVDYVGEDLLPMGDYTYSIMFDPTQSSFDGLILQLEEDD